MKKHALNIAALTIGLLLLGSIALAGQDVNKSGSASAHGTVKVKNIAGSITVVGWDKKEIEVTGTLDDQVKELKFETGKNKSVIEVIYPEHTKNIKGGADLLIKVPKDSRVLVDCVSASVDASDLTGELELASVSGQVSFVGQCRDLEASSVSGRVVIDGGAKQMSLESVSGDIRAEGEEAQIKVESVSGEIELNYERFLKVSAENVSGDIRMRGDLDPKGRFSCDVVSGDITLVLPADVNAEFEATTFSGDINNDFGQKSTRTSKYAPGRELNFSTGNGGADVELTSFSGNVNLETK